VRCPNTGRQLEDIELYCHDHETLASLRRAIYGRLKASPATLRLELVLGGEVLEVAEDRRTLHKLGFRDKVLLTAKLSQVRFVEFSSIFSGSL
jgi:ubiquitin carboxyl-terminal hydrolase 9/24